jgi:hypothetical protein
MIDISDMKCSEFLEKQIDGSFARIKVLQARKPKFPRIFLI